jgi:hypothetical protein
MRPFEVLETTDLVNVLAEYTVRYTKMLTEGGRKKDLLNCRETIRALIDEIEYRKRPGVSEDPSANNR